MLYKDTKNFSDVFFQAVPGVTRGPKPFGPWEHSPDCNIGSYLYVRDGDSLDVEPFAPVLDFVRRSMLQIEHDCFHWEIVHQQTGNLQDGFTRTGKAVLYCKYGQIIGSRAICYIDPKTIPHQG